ncbi:1-aminocyclopropane-1-carboxylate synthase-like protein 1 isoform X2 [Biomphalaria glabrata]|uniref:1-aminocyclopropane-1-carboxylate synthase-like protein 1 isoform X2 n=1 Tax=Biomphalaria glabrata TaxID=6526 RepID=A0A9U8EPH9_BIOGL|nr:1-aminocyclopropane-1-carboxylate synthase-like protein 1 isoform X2 [Biomphalaria glabrata]XP_013096834.2 1-aminocyclopropane-1-carboxylate synthase-like protein 1 isoform X2 [Biomphalaria glabrata]XP_013096835.2 1-aminocyclopropane-1-carboxylate synthase-like protein 1 isoform X2 [Biomphalaria glabrata]XP_055864208.1 1-aminocyclopropane-1-carboxylate synthase-like protein 1 isoform X2 [Biomphalaria glabrata]
MADLSSSTVDNTPQEYQVNDCTSGESGIAQSQSAHGEETLEDLLSTLSQQIKSSDWLQLNTAEKFAKENPEVAQIFKDAVNKYDSTADKD